MRSGVGVSASVAGSGSLRSRSAGNTTKKSLEAFQVKNINIDHDGEYEALAVAIIHQAAYDWLVVKTWLARNPYSDNLNTWKRKIWFNRAREAERIEEFFHSEYYRTLTNLPADVLMKKLNKVLREGLQKCEQRNI